MFEFEFKKGNSTTIHNTIIMDGRLDPHNKGVFLFLACVAGTSKFSFNDILKYNNCGVQSLKTSIKKLRELGYINYNAKNQLFSLIDNPKNIGEVRKVLKPIKKRPQVELLNGINFDSLLKFINKKTGRSFRKINDATRAKYEKLIKEGYTTEDIKTAIITAIKSEHHIKNNFTYLTPEFFSRDGTIQKYGIKTKKEETKNIDHTSNIQEL